MDVHHLQSRCYWDASLKFCLFLHPAESDWTELWQVTHAQRADGLRFLLACMVAGGLTYPPTEESFVASLQEWATLPCSSGYGPLLHTAQL